MATTDDCPTLDVKYTDGDELPELIGTLKGVDLTGFTVTLKLERPADVLTRVATFTDASQGQFKIAWLAGDLVAGRGQLAVLRAADPVGKLSTLARFLLNVERAL